MKCVPVTEAEGMVLCHDITQIVPGQFKGAAFKKGHIIRGEDIAKLLDLGKKSIYVWDVKEGLLHEDEAAARIAAAAAGRGLRLSAPGEGKVQLHAVSDGLLKIDQAGLQMINEFPQIIVAALHTNQPVPKDCIVAGTRIIPLVISAETVKKLEEACAANGPVFQVLPFKELKVGLVTTGSEVYEGRIRDGFGPVLKKKIEASGSRLINQVFVTDSEKMIAEAIRDFINRGADLVLVTGGMSVDPDDVTPAGIRLAGGTVVSYGAPVLPGSMFMLSYIRNIPVMGLPGCVMYHETSIFDLLYPRVLAGEIIERTDIIKLAHGGLCRGCEVCRYPLCSFGKC